MADTRGSGHVSLPKVLGQEDDRARAPIWGCF